MWIFKILMPAILLILIIGFALLNPSQRVNVDLYFAQYMGIQMAVVVLFSILAGMLLMFSLSIFHDLKIRARARKLRQENRRLSEELAALRTSPFQEGDDREDLT
jgi:uncharacterized integral membrane protein